VGLAGILVDDSFSFHHSGYHEHTPIPALDGGHVLFLLYEIVTGKKPGDKFLEYAQIVGMSLLLALILYANLNDIIKLFR
jgi:regulator of sigma E protease